MAAAAIAGHLADVREFQKLSPWAAPEPPIQAYVMAGQAKRDPAIHFLQ
jgi:hypothetical protein